MIWLGLCWQVFLEYAVFTDAVPPRADQALIKSLMRRYISPKLPMKGDVHDAVVSYAHTPHRFYVQLVSNERARRCTTLTFFPFNFRRNF